MRTVIFDLDGTLADTSADLIAAANACFSARGLGEPLEMGRDALVAFHGGRAMLNEGGQRVEGYGEVEVEADYPRLLDHYGENIDRHTRLYPGAVEAIEVLSARGFAVGVCTNKPEGLADRLLGRLGVRGHFASLIGADTLTVSKPDPAAYFAAVEGAGGAVGRSILVGDTETDVKTGAAAGVPVVLVAFGPEGRGIERLGPAAILERYADLPDVAEGLVA